MPRYLLTADDGKIVMTLTAPDHAAARQNLDHPPLPTGKATRIFLLPPEAGRVSDAHLFVGENGVLTPYPDDVETWRRRAEKRPSDLQHAGLQVTEIPPVDEGPAEPAS